MSSEIPVGCPDKTLYSAVYQPQENQKLIVALDGIQIVFGLPKLRQTTKGTLLTIPSTPHVFKVSRLIYTTKKPVYEYSFTLYDQVVFLCHGKKDHENPIDWELADGQNPFKLVQIINGLGKGYPKIDAIISCRSISPLVDPKLYHYPQGYRSVQNVIIQKFGLVDFGARLDNGRIIATVESSVSDFYRVNKKGELINLRKFHHRPFFHQ